MSARFKIHATEVHLLKWFSLSKPYLWTDWTEANAIFNIYIMHKCVSTCPKPHLLGKSVKSIKALFRNGLGPLFKSVFLFDLKRANDPILT